MQIIDAITAVGPERKDAKQVLHDIRTCWNHILGYGEMLIDDLEETPEEAGRVRGLVAQARSASEALHQETGFSGVLDDGCRIRRNLAELLDAFAGREAVCAVLQKMRSAAQRLEELAQDAGAAAVDRTRPQHPAGPARLVNAWDRPAPMPGRLLVIDDDAGNRDILCRQLTRQQHEVHCAVSGLEALVEIQNRHFDAVLLDLVMPDMDGTAVLQRIRGNEATRYLPVIMISGVNEVDSVIRCLEIGADDYITKPIDSMLLRARLGSLLERKKLRDEEERRTAELTEALRKVEDERAVAEKLLLNILPKTVAEELRDKGSVDAMYFEDVTIVMTDFVRFTTASRRLAAEQLVEALHEYFTGFDRIVDRYGLEKLKTVGDSYIFVGGMPIRRPSHPVDSVLAACEMIEFCRERENNPLANWQMRVGIHTGPVIAGVVGVNKFAFDVWGDSINFCSRVEAASQPNCVNVSEKTYDRVKDFFHCERREKVKTKDGAEVDMYLVKCILPDLLKGEGPVPNSFRRRYRVYFRNELSVFPARKWEPQ